MRIGHFTQVVWGSNSNFGCGATEFNNGQYLTILIACNYDCGNMGGSSVYKSGRPCSACKNGCDKEYPALCTVNEKVQC